VRIAAGVIVLASCSWKHPDLATPLATEVACEDASMPQVLVDGRPAPETQLWSGPACTPEGGVELDGCAVFADVPPCRWPDLVSVDGRHEVTVTAAGDQVAVTISHGSGLVETVSPTSLPTPPPGLCWRVDITVTGRSRADATHVPYLQAYFVLRGDAAAACDWLR